MTRTKLEQCASVLTSFNGPNFAFRLPDGGLPDDTNFPSGNTQNVTKLELARGAQFAGSVQAMLQALWPYPVCSPRGQSDCTTFPLPVPARDPDGGLNASLGCLKPPYRHTDNVNCSTNTSVDLSFLSLNSGNGVIDYHCTWAVLHTLSFNGGAVLTAAEKRAFGELVMYISGQFDCKVCRNNFVEIIRHFGLPTGSVREEYARWLWQAHNNANEHSYATHSINVNMAANEYPGQDAFKHTRTPEWSHPKHEHPWYMTFERAASVWTGLERGLWPALVAVLLLLGCHDTAAAKKKKKKVPPSAPPAPKAEFRLSSPSFGNGGEFPSDNRGDEDNMNPALAWEGAPKNTQSFVLLVDSGADDGADAAKATHWVVYDIPKEVSELRDELSGSGASDVGRLGMKEDAGQAPVVVDPMGSIDGWVDPEIENMQNMIHGALDASFEERNRAKEGMTSFGSTYYQGPSADGSMCTFKLYALSTRLELPRGASREAVVAAMKGKILGRATLKAKV